MAHREGQFERGEPRGDQLRATASFLEVLAVLYRRRWLALSVLAVCVGAAVAYVLITSPVFDARATLLIEPDVPKSVTFADAVDSTKESYFATQMQVLASRRLAARTLDEAQLWEAFGGEAAARDSSPASSAPKQRAVARFLSCLTVSPRAASRVVDLVFRASDPALAARAVNGLADAYIAQNLEFRSQASREASTWLQRQLEEQKQRVQSDELALQRYREQNGLSPQGRENLSAQTLSEVTAAATRARMDRIRKEAAYEQLSAVAKNQASLGSLPEVLANPYLQLQKSELARLQREMAQSAERLGPEHPEMLRLQAGIQAVEAKLQSEIAKMVDAARNDMLAARSQEDGLQRAVQSQRGEALKDSRQSIAFDVLQRNLASDQQVLDSLLQRAKEAHMSAQLTASNIVVLDRADLPQVPAWPKPRLVLLLGLFLGAVGSVGAAFLREHLQDGFRSAEEVQSALGVRALGLVPRFPAPADASQPRLLADPMPSMLSETFRFVRANALFAAETTGTRQFVVTSTAPGDGKTLVATNLAAALSHAGDRVLLVDGDLRVPQVHRIFNVPLDPGFSELLLGTADHTSAVRPTAVAKLSVLPAGGPVMRPADLLAAPRVRRVLQALSISFDWIIIDSPPVMTVVDACLIGRSGPAVLFVVGGDRTSQAAARAAMEQLRSSGVQVAGAVLNRTDLALKARSYAHYYKSPDVTDI